MKKKILYIDMDDVITDYIGYAHKLDVSCKEAQFIKGFFGKLKPIPGAVEAVKELLHYYEVYILTTPCWENNSSYSDKVQWIKTYFPNELDRHLILTHNKGLCKGDFLIDDRDVNGVLEFEGEWIQYNSEKFPNWDSIVNYLTNKNKWS